MASIDLFNREKSSIWNFNLIFNDSGDLFFIKNELKEKRICFSDIKKDDIEKLIVLPDINWLNRGNIGCVPQHHNLACLKFFVVVLIQPKLQLKL